MIDAALAAELRALYPHVLGKTLRVAGRLPDAEDAVQDALERALATWPTRGRPESLEGWLVQVAANRLRDRARRTRRERRHESALTALSEMSPWVQGAIADRAIARGWKDDLLRLLFACCHPCLERGESAALALATVLGLSSGEIAAAFAVAPRSMEQRLLRARARLREHGDSDAPPVERAKARVPAVLASIYVLFNEGYWSTAEEAPIRADLCRLALGLGRSVCEAFALEPEAKGLLALMLLHHSRAASRLDEVGAPVPLPEQDRSRWDRDAIAEGTALAHAALQDGPGPYAIEAAISATHARAATAQATEWTVIAELYERLERVRPMPSVRVNRAFAVARVHGARTGLALLDAGDIAIDSSAYAHLVRGALLGEVGMQADAVAELERAAALARNPHERRQIEARIANLDGERSG